MDDTFSYPLEEHYIKCRNYLYQRLNWNKISKMTWTEVFYTDISDVISLFPHLELDENYQIYCYIGTAYHGTYGTVAAIKKGCFIAAEGIRKGHWGSLDGILPESAFPVMEAIYHDGTKAGYMEAVLFSLFVHAIPYTRHEQEHWDRIADKPPQDLEENWNTWYSFEFGYVSD